jgi:hypothetical protein
VAIGNGGAGIRSSGGQLHVRNFLAADNGGPAVKLENGAKIDIDGFTHLARKNPKAPKLRTRKKKKDR